MTKITYMPDYPTVKDEEHYIEHNKPNQCGRCRFVQKDWTKYDIKEQE